MPFAWLKTLSQGCDSHLFTIFRQLLQGRFRRFSDPLKMSEGFRQLAEKLPKGSVVVGDQYYCSYFAVAMLIQQGIDVVSHLTTCRLVALGNRDAFIRLKNGDWLVTRK